MQNLSDYNDIADWLISNQVSAKMCKKIISKANVSSVPHGWQAAAELESGFSKNESLEHVRQVFGARLPTISSIINELFENLDVRYPKNTRPPFKPNTHFEQSGHVVRVETYEPTTVRGMIALTRELGVALLYVGQKEKVISPIQREICAFAAEFCFIQALRGTQSPLHARYLQAWEADNFLYLNYYGKALLEALLEKSGAYNYAWNYPIARFVGYRIFKNSNQDDLGNIFVDELPLSVFADFALSKKSDIGIGTKMSGVS